MSEYNKYLNGKILVHLKTIEFYLNLNISEFETNEDVLSSFPFLKYIKMKVQYTDLLLNFQKEFEFDLKNCDSKKIVFDLNENNDCSFLNIQKFNIEINFYSYSDEELSQDENNILTLYFKTEDLKEKLNNSGITIDDNEYNGVKKLFLVKDDFLYKNEVNFKIPFAFNILPNELINIYNNYNYKQFFCVYKMKRVLNYNFDDFKKLLLLYSSRTYKDKNLMTFFINVDDFSGEILDVVNNKSYLDHYLFLFNFFNEIQNFIPNYFRTDISNTRDYVDKNITFNKKVLIYYQDIPKLNEDDFFVYNFLQNYDEI